MVSVKQSISLFLLLSPLTIQSEIDESNMNNNKEYPRIFYQTIYALNSTNFDEKMKSQGVNGALVFFGASWCGHSRQFNATFKQLGEQVLSGSFERSPAMTYYNIKNPKDDELHKRFRVTGFPTLIYVSQDKYWTFLGERKLELMVDWFQSILEGNGREGTPYPTGDLTVWDDIGEVFRDIKFTLGYNMKHYPLYTWIGIAVISCSIGSVLFIFGILVFDSLFLGDSINETDIEPDKKEK